MDEEASISIPSIAFVAVLSYILYRFFWTPRSNSSSSTSSRARPTYTATQVDQIAQMFPQLSRRDIMWDLHRNRGNVQATTERILMGGRLEAAPPSFQPTLPLSTPATAATSTVSTVPEQDLITRYNLQTKLESKGKEKEVPNHGWSSSKDERQAMLQRRRDEMILAARRKMQDRDTGKSAPGTAGSSL